PPPAHPRPHESGLRSFPAQWSRLPRPGIGVPRVLRRRGINSCFHRTHFSISVARFHGGNRSGPRRSGLRPNDLLARSPEPVNALFHYITGLEESRRIHAHAHSFRSPGADHITWEQSHELADVA